MPAPTPVPWALALMTIFLEARAVSGASWSCCNWETLSAHAGDTNEPVALAHQAIEKQTHAHILKNRSRKAFINRHLYTYTSYHHMRLSAGMLKLTWGGRILLPR